MKLSSCALVLNVLAMANSFQPMSSPFTRPVALRAGQKQRTAEELFSGPPNGNQISPPSGLSLEQIAEQWLPCAASGINLETRNTR
jgi:hypothetical protein